MLDYICAGGKSRGSALYTDPQGVRPRDGLPDQFSFTLDDGTHAGLIQEVALIGDRFISQWREVHPIPEEDDFFENVWRAYRENENVF